MSGEYDVNLRYGVDTTMNLSGKVAVVTGASRGAGRGIAVTLGEEKEINSLTYLPRPKTACGSSIFPTACNGQIVGYEISAATGGTWVEPTEAQLRQRTYAEPADATAI